MSNNSAVMEGNPWDQMQIIVAYSCHHLGVRMEGDGIDGAKSYCRPSHLIGKTVQWYMPCATAHAWKQGSSPPFCAVHAPQSPSRGL